MPQLQPHVPPVPFTVDTRGAETVGALAAEITAAVEAEQDMRQRVRRALERAVCDPCLLSAEQRETCAQCYARHVIYSDPLGRFTIVAIVWGAGQFSPPHAHQTWCSYAVYENSLSETVYEFDPRESKAKAICNSVRDPGYSCYADAGLDQIHRLGNAGAAPAISIHVYGVGRDRISTHVNRVLQSDDQQGLDA
jgi:predicted metal-dependent enzyme (double-stranded beta helix superfamily)